MVRRLMDDELDEPRLPSSMAMYPADAVEEFIATAEATLAKAEATIEQLRAELAIARDTTSPPVPPPNEADPPTDPFTAFLEHLHTDAERAIAPPDPDRHDSLGNAE